MFKKIVLTLMILCSGKIGVYCADTVNIIPSDPNGNRPAVMFTNTGKAINADANGNMYVVTSGTSTSTESGLVGVSISTGTGKTITGVTSYTLVLTSKVRSYNWLVINKGNTENRVQVDSTFQGDEGSYGDGQGNESGTIDFPKPITINFTNLTLGTTVIFNSKEVK